MPRLLCTEFLFQRPSINNGKRWGHASIYNQLIHSGRSTKFNYITRKIFASMKTKRSPLTIIFTNFSVSRPSLAKWKPADNAYFIHEALHNTQLHNWQIHRIRIYMCICTFVKNWCWIKRVYKIKQSETQLKLIFNVMKTKLFGCVF